MELPYVKDQVKLKWKFKWIVEGILSKKTDLTKFEIGELIKNINGV